MLEVSQPLSQHHDLAYSMKHGSHLSILAKWLAAKIMCKLKYVWMVKSDPSSHNTILRFFPWTILLLTIMPLLARTNPHILLSKSSPPFPVDFFFDIPGTILPIPRECGPHTRLLIMCNAAFCTSGSRVRTSLSANPRIILKNQTNCDDIAEVWH